MYVPEHFRWDDDEAITAFVERYDFATLMTPTPDELWVTHVPLLLRASPGEGEPSRLVGHVARANPHWHAFDGERASTAIFHGPHGYVSPSWYATAPAVPTWNYVVVHVHGRVTARHDDAFKAAVVRELAARYESPRASPWLADALPEDFHRRMMAGIVGLELVIDRIEGKRKLGQNRSLADRVGALAGLERESPAAAADLAALMREHLGDE